MAERPCGITAYAAALPAFVLATTRFGEVSPADARRARAVANHDEDAVTLAVEAARHVAGAGAPATLVLATSDPPYLGKSLAGTVHAALELPATVGAVDLAGLRGGATALGMVFAAPVAAVVADLRTPPPGSADELGHGDAAAAFSSAPAGGGAVLVGRASATIEVLDRWRLPGERHEQAWDERFVADVLAGPAVDAARRALAEAGLDGADHVVVSAANPRVAAACRAALGGDGEDAVLEAQIGHTGAAHLGVLVADALDRCVPGATVLAVGVADGADAFVLRAGEGIAEARAGRPVREQLAHRIPLTYDRYLRLRGLLSLQGAKRPDPAAPASPPMVRRRDWKFGLVASRCTACGAVETPPGRVCPSCGAVDQGEPVDLRERVGHVVSFTLDRLAPSPDPPVVLAVVDLEGGGRRSAQVTDLAEPSLAVGARLVPTFRRLHTSEGIHNYFWKLRPEER